MLNNRLSWTALSFGLLLLGLATQANASMNAELLRADFNDKPLNVQIGTGGASVGEPVSVPADLIAKVQAAPFATPSLHFSRATVGARSARFDFIDAEEIHSGELRILFTVRTPPALSAFRVSVSDQVTATATFAGLDFRTDGTILTLDTPAAVGSYVPNEDLRIEYVFQVVGGTYDLFINGVQKFNDRPQGNATNEKGIGALFFGFPTGTNNQEWVVDDIHVVRTPSLLNADFDDKPLDMQIGAGGPTVGEPTVVETGLMAKVQAGTFSTPGLVLEKATTGFSLSAYFEFLNNREIVAGELRISFRIRIAPVADEFGVVFRENGSSSLVFGTLILQASGDIIASDSSGALVVGNYMLGDELFVEYRYSTDAATYDLYINRVLVLDDRAHGVNTLDRGIGRIGLVARSATTSQWAVDDLYVYQPGVLFQDGFD